MISDLIGLNRPVLLNERHLIDSHAIHIQHLNSVVVPWTVPGGGATFKKLKRLYPNQSENFLRWKCTR